MQIGKQFTKLYTSTNLKITWECRAGTIKDLIQMIIPPIYILQAKKIFLSYSCFDLVTPLNCLMAAGEIRGQEGKTHASMSKTLSLETEIGRKKLLMNNELANTHHILLQRKRPPSETT